MILEALILLRLGSVNRRLREAEERTLYADDEGLEGFEAGVVFTVLFFAFLAATVLWPIGLALIIGLRLERRGSLLTATVVSAAVGVVSAVWGWGWWLIVGILVATELLVRELDEL